MTAPYAWCPDCAAYHPPEADCVLAAEQFCRHVVSRLSAVLACDPAAVTALLDTRVPCATAVAQDSWAMCSYALDGTLRLSAGGLLNTLVAPHYRVAAHYGEDDVITRFSYYRVEE